MIDGLRGLAHDLSEAPRAAQRDSVAVVEKAAVNVKKKWAANARASGGDHTPAYPSSISYDLHLFAALAGDVEAEIGPDKSRRQGALGNLIEFGSVHNPPHNDGGRALKSEAPAFEAALAKVTLDALGWR